MRIADERMVTSGIGGMLPEPVSMGSATSAVEHTSHLCRVAATDPAFDGASLFEKASDFSVRDSLGCCHNLLHLAPNQKLAMGTRCFNQELCGAATPDFELFRYLAEPSLNVRPSGGHSFRFVIEERTAAPMPDLVPLLSTTSSLWHRTKCASAKSVMDNELLPGRIGRRRKVVYICPTLPCDNCYKANYRKPATTFVSLGPHHHALRPAYLDNAALKRHLTHHRDRVRRRVCQRGGLHQHSQPSPLAQHAGRSLIPLRHHLTVSCGMSIYAKTRSSGFAFTNTRRHDGHFERP